MNYLSHAYRFLDTPYFAAGTALPDWMSVIDRKNRARKQYAAPVTNDADERIAAFAAGCVQHHVDDDWFHSSALFTTMSTQFAVEIRERLEPGLGHQAGFLGHIIIELLLDAVLIERDPVLLERYYDSLLAVEPEIVQEAANKICRQPVDKLVILIPRFHQERFIADYVTDEGLLYRLGGVMRRVKLPPLPDRLLEWFPAARERVRDVADELITPRNEA